MCRERSIGRTIVSVSKESLDVALEKRKKGGLIAKNAESRFANRLNRGSNKRRLTITSQTDNLGDLLPTERERLHSSVLFRPSRRYRSIQKRCVSCLDLSEGELVVVRGDWNVSTVDESWTGKEGVEVPGNRVRSIFRMSP